MNADMNALNCCQSDVALMLAMTSNDIKMVTNLLSLCRVDPDTLFRVAMNEVPAVLYCIEKGNYEIAKGLSCLHLAVNRQNLELCRLLIEKKAIIDSPTLDTKETPLHYACNLSSLEIVKLLVDNNANLNYRNIDGITPLMIAAKCNRLEIVEYLLTLDKIDVNLVDNKKSSALIYATTSLSVQLPVRMIELLVQSGANVNHHDNFGGSALNRIISSSSESNLTGTELVSLLIDNGCDLENQNSKLKPIHLSILHGQDSITELLIRSGCDLNSLNINNEPVLLSLIRNNKVSLVRLAVDAGADLNYFIFKLERDFKLSINDLIRRVNDLELKDYLIDLFAGDYRCKSLIQLSRLAIRRQLGRRSDKLIKQFNIPVNLKNYLLLKDY